MVVRSEYATAIEALGLFDFSDMGKTLINRCPYMRLSKRLKVIAPVEYQDFEVRFRTTDAKNAIKGKSTTSPKVSAFREWLNGSGVAVRNRLAEPYRLATPKDGARIYIEELWFDIYHCTWNRAIKFQSPLVEDGLLIR